MSNKSSDFVGMPPPANFVVDGDKLTNVNRGNPLGDKVDNSAGSNVQQSVSDPIRQTTGHNLSMYSKPSWLCK